MRVERVLSERRTKIDRSQRSTVGDCRALSSLKIRTAITWTTFEITPHHPPPPTHTPQKAPPRPAAPTARPPRTRSRPPPRTHRPPPPHKIASAPADAPPATPAQACSGPGTRAADLDV